MRNVLKVSAMLAPLALSAHAEDPPTCGDIVLLASAEEVAATPRARPDVEYLALEQLGTGFTVDPATYRRVLADTDAIRALVPAVGHITYTNLDYDSDTFILGFDPATAAAVRAGTFTSWDCLNDWYDVELLQVWDIIDAGVVQVSGAYDLERLITQYTQVPGIDSGELNWRVEFPFALDPPTLCAMFSPPSTYHYFFSEDPTHTHRLRHYFTTSAAGRPSLHGQWDFPTTRPAPWLQELYDFCYFGTHLLPATLGADPPVPTADDDIVLTASGPASSSCAPSLGEVVFDPGERTIRIVADFNPPCGACTLDVVPYSLDVPLGQLEAGDYHVTFLGRDGCGDALTLEAATVLTVEPSPGSAAGCAGGNAPAATLLFPWFEVDIADPEGKNTLLAIQNTASEPTLARVVLWTDWGLPTYGFTVYLPGDGGLTLSMQDIFRHGNVPITGSGIGSIDGAPGCSDPIANPALFSSGPLGVAGTLDILRNQHRGAGHGGLCYGSDRPGWLAVGYVTVDVVDDCSDTVLYPTDDGYFGPGGSGLAGLRNVLWGDAFYLDSSQDSAQGIEAVAITADAALDEDQPTFYRTYSGGSDQRRPLATGYRARYLRGGGLDMETELIVWSEGTGAAAEPLPCGESPNDGGLSARLNVVTRDMEGGVTGSVSPALEERAFKLAVGGEMLPVTADFGQIDLETYLTCSVCSPPGFFPRQTRVIPVMSADGRFSVALPATRLDGSCP